MKLTNKYKLPEVLYNAIKEKYYPPSEDRLSVTDLINPPLMRTLKLKEWDNIEHDASNDIWLLLGVSLHSYLEKAGDNAYHEVKIEYPVVSERLGISKQAGLVIVGKIDRLTLDHCIEDYKLVSVNADIDRLSEKWAEQLNLYAELYREVYGKPVLNLAVHLIFKDWQRNRKDYRGYPSLPFKTVYLERWDRRKTKAFLEDRLYDHLINPERECSRQEKWQHDDIWAVMTRGRDRARRLFKSKDAAARYIREKKLERQLQQGKIYVQKRPGECVRCEHYCLVSNVCPYFAKMKRSIDYGKKKRE